jgi:hypothetical protein
LLFQLLNIARVKDEQIISGKFFYSLSVEKIFSEIIVLIFIQNIFIQICCMYTEGKYMKNSVIAIPSQNVVITTMMYALLCPICFESDTALGEGETFFVNNDKTMMYSQQAIEEEVETECKSPCPSSAEMCIEMCA